MTHLKRTSNPKSYIVLIIFLNIQRGLAPHRNKIYNDDYAYMVIYPRLCLSLTCHVSVSDAHHHNLSTFGIVNDIYEWIYMLYAENCPPAAWLECHM